MEIDYREVVNLDFRQGKGIVSSLERPEQLCCLPSRLLNAYRRYITRWLKLTTRLRQVSRFRTCGFVPPLPCMSLLLHPVAYPGILFRGEGGGSTNSVEDRGQRNWGSGGGTSLVRGSGGSCNLIQEISFHIVKFS